MASSSHWYKMSRRHFRHIGLNITIFCWAVQPFQAREIAEDHFHVGLETRIVQTTLFLVS